MTQRVRQLAFAPCFSTCAQGAFPVGNPGNASAGNTGTVGTTRAAQLTFAGERSFAALRSRPVTPRSPTTPRKSLGLSTPHDLDVIRLQASGQ